jgi:hypothetical protein
LRLADDPSSGNQKFPHQGEDPGRASVSRFKKRHEFVTVVTLFVACVFSTSCTAWHTIPLQPERFSADRSPELVRLTLSDGTKLTAGHPVLVGDSLVWVDQEGATSRDSTRSAVLTSGIQRAEVNRVDAGNTITALVFVGGAVGGLLYFWFHVVPGISGN